ncbi:MAG: hypothetical protein IKR92_04840 [Alphaproteobacteria bacterium]|nr:hypothetical protein [Alphaproteobacteria bacterium]
MTNAIFWMLFLGGRFLGAVLILSLVLAFVRNQTRKNIIIAGVIGFLFATFLGFCGYIDGRLLTWPLARFLLLNALIDNGIAFIIAILLTIWRHWNTQKWFAKVLPWIAGVLYGLILLIAFPMEVKDQYEIQQVATEMTLKQFFAMPEYDKREATFKIVGVKDGNIFGCVQANEKSPDAQDFLLKEVIDACRDIIYGNPAQDSE